MSYKSLKEAISCTQTQQSSKFHYQDVLQTILVILAIIIGLGIVIGMPIFLIIYSEPPPTKFSVVKASIVRFNLASSNTLYYNFMVTITAKNFHSNIESYNKVTAIASYNGNQLASVKLAPFKISSKNIDTLEPIVFKGNTLMIFEPQQLVEYNKETQLGIYNLDFDLDLNYSDYHIHCPSLRVPLISNGKVAPTFNVTTCSYMDDRN
ncbi:hypothetical protein TSUD_351690 [Trifolium subterraneum]|uniref:Late embryogenesis abundant protein LEA-2 subgroup domain-containing protein n=1 Tax=Trifolium subterraneum TaxID=3900 RepID=A0A2Z6PNG8_TRISU|nr:hypothetical protein TSUD_351690 [Trifolium subterraneum]